MRIGLLVLLFSSGCFGPGFGFHGGFAHGGFHHGGFGPVHAAAALAVASAELAREAGPLGQPHALGASALVDANAQYEHDVAATKARYGTTAPAEDCGCVEQP